jgi:hypothetical protein
LRKNGILSLWSEDEKMDIQFSQAVTG